jgi:hypothetical protein
MSKAKLKGCVSKRRYSTRSLAETVGTIEENSRGVSLRVYYCGYCYGFHLTKKKKGFTGACSNFYL